MRKKKKEAIHFKVKWWPLSSSSSCLIDWFSSSNNPSIIEHSSKKGRMTSETEYSLSLTYLGDVLFKVKCCPLLTFSLWFCVLFLAFARSQKDSHTHLFGWNQFSVTDFEGVEKTNFSFLPSEFLDELLNKTSWRREKIEFILKLFLNLNLKQKQK